MRHHDLVVIGTGSGNSIIDSRFDDLDVGLIEHGVFGGTCLNVGCIPTKMYVYPADVAQHIRHAARYGIDASIDKVRWTDIRDRIFGRIDPISAGGQEYRVHRSPERHRLLRPRQVRPGPSSSRCSAPTAPAPTRSPRTGS